MSRRAAWGLPVAAADHRAVALDRALECAGSRLVDASGDRRRFRIPGSRRIAEALMTPHWLSFSLQLRASARPLDGSRVLALLRRNARIRGTPRIVDASPRRELVVDLPDDALPWHQQAELDAVVGSVLAEMRNAATARMLPRNPQTARRPGPEALESLFEDAGWPAHRVDDGRLVVPLELNGDYLTASADVCDGAVDLGVSLLVDEIDAADTVCRDAVTLLLWRAASRIRMVRPLRRRRGLGLEVSVPLPLARAGALGHGCKALSLALQHLSAECCLLIADRRLAWIYLSTSELGEAT